MPTADACAANEAVVRRIFDAFARKERFAFRDLFAADAVWTVPGDGAIPLERLLGELLEAGYTGVFDLELVGPRIESEGNRAASRRAAERISEILTRLGA